MAIKSGECLRKNWKFIFFSSSLFPSTGQDWIHQKWEQPCCYWQECGEGHHSLSWHLESRKQKARLVSSLEKLFQVWAESRACLLKNPGELKIALLKGLWRAVRRVIIMKNCKYWYKLPRWAKNHSPVGFKVSFWGELLIAFLKNQALWILIVKSSQ